MDAVKTAIERFGAGELSSDDRQLIDARLKRDPEFSGLVEITKTVTDEDTSSSCTLCGFAAVDGFMGIQDKHSLYLVELENVIRDPEHHSKPITDLLETVGRKVRAHRYYDVEVKCIVRQTTAYLSRLHGIYRLPPFRIEGLPPTTGKSKRARADSSDSDF